MEIRPYPGGVGIEVTGVDLRNIDEASFQELKRSFDAEGLLFIRGQELSEDQHIEFAERWGEIDVNRFFQNVPGHPQIALVNKEPDQQINIGGGWHTDHSYDAAPALGSILRAVDLPKTGGDTLFASMYKAAAGLSDGLRRQLRGMRAVHSSQHIFGENSGYTRAADSKGPQFKGSDVAAGEVSHPVLIAHPRSGGESLYVNPAFTLRFEGWTALESKPLLDFLYTRAMLAENTSRFQWEPGSLAFWDNRCTWHYALNDYHGQRREMHRITLRAEDVNGLHAFTPAA